MGGGGNTSSIDQNALLLQQQQRDLASQQRLLQARANQYEYDNLGLLTQQLEAQRGTESAMSARLQNLYNVSGTAQAQYQGILSDLLGLQAQQYDLNANRTGLERQYITAELGQSQAIADMVRNRTALLAAEEQTALFGYSQNVPRAQNSAAVAYGNYRLGSLQPYAPTRSFARIV